MVEIIHYNLNIENLIRSKNCIKDFFFFFLNEWGIFGNFLSNLIYYNIKVEGGSILL